MSDINTKVISEGDNFDQQYILQKLTEKKKRADSSSKINVSITPTQ